MSAQRPTVLLFDVDGTLITTGGGARRAIERTFERLYRAPGALDDVHFGGMTDRAIFRAGLRAIGVADDEAAIDRVLEAYLERLAEELGAAGEVRTNPGVSRTLEALEGRAGIALGLGTGNVRRGAAIKLSAVDLDRAFAFGGFGCDAEQRDRLLASGARRGAAVLGVPVQRCRVVVIGDTPKDVHAARAIGAESVGVATGGFEAGALADAGADRVVANLDLDPDRWLLP